MWIDELKENEIFVFGSNARGQHRGGAARTAHDKFGAVWGQARGLQGRSYAIDSMSGLDTLREEARAFYAFAGEHPELRFLVTPIGIGIAGYSANEVAPIFVDPPDNVRLPEEFVDVLGPRPQLERLSLAGVDALAPDSVDDFGNDVVPGLMLGGPFDGSLIGLPIFGGAGAPLGAGHPVQADGRRGVVAWYELRTPIPVAERYVYEFDGFRDPDGSKLDLDIAQGSVGRSTISLLDLGAGDMAIRGLAALRGQIEEVRKQPPAQREESWKRLGQLSTGFTSGRHHERLWNIDDPVRTEIQALRALAEAMEREESDEEHIVAQYLSRAVYARGDWWRAGHPIAMGDYWWAVQLSHLIRARRALAEDAIAGGVHALTVVVGSLWSGGVDFDYILEGLAELAFLGVLGLDHPTPKDWAATAFDLINELPDWSPGAWFTPELRERLGHIAEAPA